MASAIEVRQLSKRYGRLAAVAAIDLAVAAGEVFAFLGPNGAGKTTTVEILEGLRPRTAGEVGVLGLDPWRDARALQRRIGVIPQDFHFFPKLNPREAIELYGGLFGVRPDARELLERVDLADKARDAFDTLSGGQRQKLGLALALVNDPEICFLDEPTTGLDPRARRSIWEVIARLKSEGRTVFLTTHYLEEAQQLADRLAIIHHGRIIARGTPDEIIARYGRPERLRLVAGPDVAERLRGSFPYPVRVAGDAVEVDVPDRHALVRVVDAVEASGLAWSGLSTVADTLEDVFIRLVGRLEDGSDARAPAAGGAA